MDVFIKDFADHVGETVTIKGWAQNVRSSGSIAFLQMRDGSGFAQAVVAKNGVDGSSWQVVVRAFNSDLEQVEATEFSGVGAVGEVHRLGEFRLSANQTCSTPLLITSEVRQNEALTDRTFYWINYEAIQGSLFNLPRTRLALELESASTLVVTNIGEKPAVGVHFVCPSGAEQFSCSDAFFWLDPGERCRIAVNRTEGVSPSAWNTD